MRRIALIGGYTAGHVFPMLAVAEAYRAQDPGAALFFIGGRDSLEASLIKSHGHACHEIDGTPLYGVPTALGRLRSYGAALRGFAQARRLLAHEHADLALGFGGYITVGPMLAARTLGIATAIFEANVVPGRTNRLVQRWMAARLIGFPETAQMPGWRASEVVGYPLRSEIVAQASQVRTAPAGRAAQFLVTGGSRGSAFLNRAAPGLLAEIARRGVPVEVMHQTGLEFPERVASAYRDAGVPAVVEGFAAGMAAVYTRADFVICAAGAGTLAEIAALGLPALVVPTSAVADDHQVANARAFAARTGATWVRETDWDERGIADQLAAMLGAPEAWAHAARRMQAFARLDAATSVVAACERLLAAHRQGATGAVKAVPR